MKTKDRSKILRGRGDPCGRPGQAQGLPVCGGWPVRHYSQKMKERSENVYENKGSLKNTT